MLLKKNVMVWGFRGERSLEPNFVIIFISCYLIITSVVPSSSLPCSPRSYSRSSVVCVCNRTHCDTLEDIVAPQPGSAFVYQSDRSGKRFQKTPLTFQSSQPESPPIISLRPEITITIDANQKYQEILGFGGAFTDAAGINIDSLPTNMRETLIRDYFSKVGLEYNLGRVPIASCDFSTSAYSYDDVPDDFQLENFHLAEEDFKYKIPYIKKATSEISKSGGDQLHLIASPWAPPPWMKTSNRMIGMGTLKSNDKGPYQETWARHFVKFLEAYESRNVSIWGLTVENEPSAGFIPFYPFQCLGFTGETEREFVANYLGPTLEKAGYGVDKVKLLIFDDQRPLINAFTDQVLSDPEAAKYVSGIAFHWYLNTISLPSQLDEVHNKYPDKFILATEACTGSNLWEIQKVALGSWSRAERYALDIIADLNHFTTGWIDWNLALNPEGGPNFVGNFVDSPVIVNAQAQEYYKQPMFYALGHFSKFLPRSSVRIKSQSSSLIDILYNFVAFQRPDGAKVLIILNRSRSGVKVKIVDPSRGYLTNDLGPSSIQSYIWL